MTNAHWSDALQRLDACAEAVEWARTQPDYETAWRECQRGDWMLWLAARASGKRGSDSHRAVVLAACACATLARCADIVREMVKRPKLKEAK